MTIFSRFETSDGCKEDTGFHWEVLWFVWHKYKTVLPDWGTLRTFHYFYLCYVFIHHYPRVRHFSRVMYTKEFGLVHKKEFYSHVFHGVMAKLAANMDEISWAKRLHAANHAPHFKSNVTCIVDTFPIIVYQPVDPAARKTLYSGKYKATVLKVEIFVTFTGEIVCATGVHMGGEWVSEVDDDLTLSLASFSDARQQNLLI